MALWAALALNLTLLMALVEVEVEVVESDLALQVRGEVAVDMGAAVEVARERTMVATEARASS